MSGRLLAVAQRELRGFFDHPTAYILLVVFLGLNFFFFFREAYLLGEASLRPMIQLLPWLLLFFVPAVTMRSLAEERRAGTIEVVLAQPVSVLEFLLGKYLGVLGFLLITLLATLGAAVGLSWGADLQWGVIVAQYVGSALLLAALVAIGLWTSALAENQVSAFILGVAVTFLFYLVGLEVVVLGLPTALAQVASRIGILQHFGNIARGVIDLRDVLYFASLAAAFLALTYHSVQRKRLSHGRVAYRRLSVGTAALVALAVMVSLLGGRVRGRLDLTPGKAYTLSPATRAILGGLDDLVTVKLFASRELPPEFVPVQRDTDDLLRDFEAAGGANLTLQRLTPEGENEARREATNLGIPPIQFNVFGEEELQVRQGYLGIAVQYAGQTEVLPVVQQTRDLEYRLASAVRSLTRERRPAVAFLTGHGEKELFTGVRLAGGQLQQDYGVQSLALDSATTVVPDTVDVLVIAGPSLPFSARDGAALDAFLADGGSIFLALTGARVNPRGRTFTPQSDPLLASLLSAYGVSVEPGLVYDLRSRANLPVRGEGGVGYIVPYPLWPIVLPVSEHPVVRELGSVMAPWASAIELTAELDTTRVMPLLATSEFGGRLPGPGSIDPDQNWAEMAALGEELDIQVVAMALSPPRDAEPGRAIVSGESEAEADDEQTEIPLADGPRGRIVVVASAELIADEYVQGNPDAVRFFQNAVDWLAQDEALIAIRGKDRSPPRLLFSSPLVRDAAKYGNMVGLPLLFVLYGAVRLARRRRRQPR